MKKSKFTESQIFKILKESEADAPIAELIKKHAISQATYFKWKSKYGGMQLSDVKPMKALEQENFRLIRMYADLSLNNSLLKGVIKKSSGACAKVGLRAAPYLQVTVQQIAGLPLDKVKVMFYQIRQRKADTQVVEVLKRLALKHPR